MKSTEPGEIVTFYSYKGGTGRTMALANIAWILAANGKRVLVADWDLESPGLHRFFRPFLNQTAVSATPGVIDMITEYKWATMRTHDLDPPDWHREYAKVQRYAVSLEWDFPHDGLLDFLSAGRQIPDYSSAVASIDWDAFYEEYGGGLFIDALRDDMRANYDYTLVDSRTGLSDVADICTVHLPDVLVDCFTLSDQGIEGAAAVAKDIAKRYADRGIRILPVPMRIDEGEKEKADAGRALARARFDGFPTDMAAADAARYWSSMEIPYRPFYAYEETLATFGDLPGQATSILSALERLTGFITRDAVTSMPPYEEAERLRILRSFTRRRPSSTLELVVSYVPEDRMWADWMAKVLTAAELSVVLMDATAPRSPERPAPGGLRVLVVLSQHYMRYPRALEYAREVADTDPSGSREQLVPILVGDVHPPFPTLTGRIAADLTVGGEDAALAALYRAVDRTSPPARDESARFPGTIPPVFNIAPRNPNFTGRNEILESLRNQLATAPVSVVIPVALHGLGGVGKTQVALEYSHRFKADYDLVWWVDAEQPDQINRSLAELAMRLDLRVGESLVEAARSACDALRSGRPHRRWLLVLDNADELADLPEYIPVDGPGRILITSRNQQSWRQLAKALEVNVFARDESVNHLSRRVPALGESDAIRIAEVLGDLPLAIEVAAAWLAETGTPASQYISMLEEESATKVFSMGSAANYPRSLLATWGVSVERLRSRSTAAVRLLELCSFFAPEISIELIYGPKTIEALAQYDSSLRMPMMLGRITQELSRLALAKVDLSGNSIQVHRLVQSYMRDQLDTNRQVETQHQVHAVLAAARPARGDVDDPRNWEQYQLLWPHLTPSNALDCNSAEVRQLLIDRLRYFWKTGDFARGLELGRQLEETWTESLEGDTSQAQSPSERELLHRQILFMKSQVANIRRSIGQFETAAGIDRAVLEEQRRVLPPDDMHTLITASNLGADLRSLGEFEDALTMDKSTYASLKETFGDDHERTLAAANNLAVSHRLIGDFHTAWELDVDTLDRRRRVLGHDHPYTMITAINLARDLRELGQYQQSITLLQQTYTSFVSVLTENSQEALRAATSLAAAFRDAGRHEEARKLTEETFKQYREEFDADTPDAFACRLNLAADLAATGDLEQGINDARAAYSRYENRLGPQHPYTLAALNNLGVYLWRAGKWMEALPFARRCVEGLTTKLGSDHPYSITASVNLANCLAAQGDLLAARQLDEDAFERFERSLGHDHPDSLIAAANRAQTLEMLGDPDRARSMRLKIVSGLVKCLGEGHPTILEIRSGRRIDREIEPQPV
jgi:MinD-like ATPase involved in chromosome partitioning or flagellar assembly